MTAHGTAGASASARDRIRLTPGRTMTTPGAFRKEGARLFRSAAERAQFSSELTAAIAQLAARYHDASAPGGRSHRLVLVAHPLPQERKETAI